MERTAAQSRRLIASLKTAPLRTCYSMHECCFCETDITLGSQYHDRGYDRRCHVECLKFADVLWSIGP